MSAGGQGEMLAQNMTWMRRREAEKKATRRAMAKAEVEFYIIGSVLMISSRPGDSRWRS